MMKNIELAEDIISEVMADEEMRLRHAVENNYFYSVILLNKCRQFFDMKPVKRTNRQNKM